MTLEEARTQIDELRATLNYHAEKYYNEDAPEIDDYEYDQLMNRLKALEQQFPQLVTPDSPTQRVGGEASRLFTPVTHTRCMWSSRRSTGCRYRSNTGTAGWCAVPRAATDSSARM